MDADIDDHEAKRQARVKAGLAKRGFTLVALADGSWWVSRNGLFCSLIDWQAVEVWLRKATGPM